MSRKLIDLTGLTFGRLLVLNRSGTRETPNGTKRPVWLCRCSCGGEVEVAGFILRNGASQSCGCLRREVCGVANLLHGMTGSPEHQSWRGMRERCTNPNNSHYLQYGGAGVHVCKRWGKFVNFYEDMGPRPEGTTLDRYPNPRGDYKPTNCRWATLDQQSRNTLRTVHITWKGRTQCRKDWAVELGLTTVALKFRIRNWGLKRAMTTPKLGNGGRRKSN